MKYYYVKANKNWVEHFLIVDNDNKVCGSISEGNDRQWTRYDFISPVAKENFWWPENAKEIPEHKFKKILFVKML